MKYLNKLFIVAGIFMLVSACDNTDLDIQQDPNSVAPDRASVNDLFNNMQLTFARIFSQFERTPGQTVRMHHAGGNFNYENFTTPTSFTGLWFNAYSELFPDVDALLSLAAERGLDVHAGIAKIMKAYTLIGMIDILGSVPLSQAGQGTDLISPAADAGDQVYSAALSMLDDAVSQLSGTSATGPSNDLYYGGDASKWVKLANTIKLKAAINMKDAGTVNAMIASGNIITDAADDFQARFGTQRTNPNSRHPDYNSQYETGDGPYQSNYYMWLLRADKEDVDGNPVIDPRIRYYYYRKVLKTAEQDQTTYSCHFSTLPVQSAQPAHWKAVDPRLPYCIASDDGYSGRDHLNGEGTPPDGPIKTSFGLYPAGGQFDDNSFEDTRKEGTTGGLGGGIYPIMLSSYVDFLRAEAAMTMGTGEDARALMESGIRKSMEKVESFEELVSSTMSSTIIVRDEPRVVKELYGLSPERVDNYVNFVLDSYDNAPSDDKRLDIAMKEFYIALWGNGYEAYNMYRRTGKPDNMQPALEPDYGEFIRTFFLPDVHVNRNANASQKSLTERVFWDDGSKDLY